MIILSQDRKKIFNFDNISIIHIMDNNKIWVDTEKTCNNLGTYKTEERAKEILEEIVTLFKNEEILHITKSALNNLDEIEEPKYILKPVCRAKVYYMPKE